MSRSRDAEYTEYAAARLPSLRELAAVLCGDWQRADDLVQATLTMLYVNWGRVRAATTPTPMPGPCWSVSSSMSGARSG